MKKPKRRAASRKIPGFGSTAFAEHELRAIGALERDIERRELEVAAHYRVMQKLCREAFANGIRTAPASEGRRYVLRDPNEADGFCYAPDVGMPEPTISEQLVGDILNDWVRAHATMRLTLSTLVRQRPSHQQLIRLVRCLRA